MGDVGACWDNAAMERFWGSLKHEWFTPHKSRNEAGRGGLHPLLQSGQRSHLKRRNIPRAI
ncbi:hypothetical protein QI600_004823 [Salmonella enterica]|nr:hypothetical protein [Salmonella enterica]